VKILAPFAGHGVYYAITDGRVCSWILL